MHLPARWRTVVSAATAALAATALVAAPAAAGTGPSPGGCPVVPTVQPFAPWQDFADYFLAPDGNIEAGASSWQLTGGASAVEGDRSLPRRQRTDHRSLRMPAGASATTAPICIGVEHKQMRFFGTSTKTGTLAVDALYTKRGATQKTVVSLGSVGGTGAWAPSPVLAMRVNELAGAYGNALPVSLRFTVRGSAPWQIDDVYVDPYSKKSALRRRPRRRRSDHGRPRAAAIIRRCPARSRTCATS